MKTMIKKAGITLATLGLAATGALMSGAPAHAGFPEAPGPNQYRDYGPIGGTEAWNYFDGYLQCLRESKELEWSDETPLYGLFEHCQYHNDNGFVYYRLSWSDGKNA